MAWDKSLASSSTISYVNPEIADEVFELDVPAGVDVIGGEG